MHIKFGFVLIGVLLLVSAVVCNSNKDTEQLEFIDELNALRRKFAKKNNIVNMHELSFDQKLMNETIEMNSTRKFLPGRFFKYRNTFIGWFSDGAKELRELSASFERKSEEEKLEVIKKATTKEDLSFEHLTPGHTKIGCAKLGRLLCLLAPDGNLSSWFSEASEAGSLCMNGYKNVDGLCSRVSKAEATTSTATSQNHKTSLLSTTAESELDRQIAKYKNEEQDGDVYDEDFPTTVIVSLNDIASARIPVFFVVFVLILIMIKGIS